MVIYTMRAIYKVVYHEDTLVYHEDTLVYHDYRPCLLSRTMISRLVHLSGKWGMEIEWCMLRTIYDILMDQAYVRIGPCLHPLHVPSFCHLTMFCHA